MGFKTRRQKDTEIILPYRPGKVLIVRGDLESIDKVFGDIEELVGNINPNQRNWRGIGIALLVILIVCAIVITAVILVTPNEQDDAPGEKFILDDIFSADYRPREFHAPWLSGKEEFLYKNEENSVVRYDALANKSYLIMDNATFIELETDQYKVSADLQYILIAHDEHAVYRHSRVARYKIKVSDKTVKKRPTDLAGGEQLQYVGWGPKNNALVYVQGNNIYYKRSVSATETVNITSDGRRDVYNGIPDWVYEEEILSSSHAIWWSPEGQSLCYAKFDDTPVRKYHYPVYGQASDAYTHINAIAYPKPGYPNPIVTIHTVNLRTMKNATLRPPEKFRNGEHIFTAISWRDEDFVSVVWSNRVQNHSIISICQAADGTCMDSMHELGHGGWVELLVPPRFLDKGTKYAMILSQKYNSNTGYFKRVTIVTVNLDNSGADKTYLTSGLVEAHSIVGHSETKKLIYYLANKGILNSTILHLYSVGYDESNSNFKKSTCLSCSVAKEKCQYVSASFSQSGRFYILGCLGPGVPFYVLMDTCAHSTSKCETKYTMLESNARLKSKLEGKALPKKKYFNVTVNGEALRGYYYVPHDYKSSEILTYPVLITTYAGPSSQVVTKKFKIDWLTYLASTHNIICAGIDGHGSKGRGDKFEHSVYRRLGTIEVQDQILATKKYFDTKPFAEKSKMAIWGWSYGGYVSLMALADTAKVFKCAIAVAPVTDWRYYDSLYTERYMGRPWAIDNQAGYKVANVSAKASQFPQDSLLLIHGTGDDNVHFQHTAQLMHFLTEAGIRFRSQIYTDKHHGLSGDATRRHLYTTMENFLEDCLGLETFRQQQDKHSVSNKQEDKMKDN